MTAPMGAVAAMGRNVYWYLLPLIVVVSLVYSATRYEEWPIILRRAVRLAVFIAGFMGVILAFLWACDLWT